MIKRALYTLSTLAILGGPVAADPLFGVGLTFTTDGNIAFGVRVFSDDRSGEIAAGIGLDYKFRTKTWRPNIGAAYLKNDWYLDLTAGIDPVSGQVDGGIGIGGLGGGGAKSTRAVPVAPPPPVPPTTPATPTTPTAPTTPTGPTDLPT